MTAEVRTIKTAAEQALAETYAKAKGTLPGAGTIATLRDAAFRQFDAQGLPHRRVEEWKYTDLRALVRDAKPLAAPPDASAKATAGKIAAPFSALKPRQLTVVDGMFVADQSDLTAEAGLRIGSMSEALVRGDALVAAHVGKVFETADPALALNTSLMGDGAVIHVAAGTQVARPIALIFAGTQDAAVFTRSLVVVDKGATVTLIEIHESGSTQVNTALELVAGEGARVDHLKITRAGALHLSTLLARIGARTAFNSFAFTRDSTLVRNQSFVRFAGGNTEAAIGGLSLLKGKEHVDNTLVIEHAAVGGVSRERFRSVLEEQGRAVFQGKIIVAPGAQQTDAKMLSNALLLSDDAEADNKPELEIFADDVQCGHGATAGALDEELLFYLRARGIPRQEAEALLVQAFVGEVIDSLPQDSLREPLMNAAVEWLRARG
ncbi:MAG: Iron-sulfur cluster assembly protein SufD [Pseudolabrys sp.]|jgi:Fe-S cluster assembly protein SufD|nr:Iron-sulfur cluster assembly protein SufD [Pseudolabrys sp.]